MQPTWPLPASFRYETPVLVRAMHIMLGCGFLLRCLFGCQVPTVQVHTSPPAHTYAVSRMGEVSESRRWGSVLSR